MYTTTKRRCREQRRLNSVLIESPSHTGISWPRISLSTLTVIYLDFSTGKVQDGIPNIGSSRPQCGQGRITGTRWHHGLGGDQYQYELHWTYWPWNLMHRLAINYQLAPMAVQSLLLCARFRVFEPMQRDDLSKCSKGAKEDKTSLISNFRVPMKKKDEFGIFCLNYLMWRMILSFKRGRLRLLSCKSTQRLRESCPLRDFRPWTLEGYHDATWPWAYGDDVRRGCVSSTEYCVDWA